MRFIVDSPYPRYKFAVMIKTCVICDSEMPALSCGTVCSPGCRTAQRNGIARKQVAVAVVSVKKVDLSDLFNEDTTRDVAGAFERFLESVRANPTTIRKVAEYYFYSKYVDWKADHDKKPRCDYCGEIARKGSLFCGDECEKAVRESEERQKIQEQRDKERTPLSPLKSCHHCGSAFKSVYGDRYCTEECNSAARLDFRENGHICAQCDKRSPGRAYRNFYCSVCQDEIDEIRTAKEQAKQAKRARELEEYERYRELFPTNRENEIRIRELRSIKQLTTEQKAKLRHYGDLTKSIDKGELISVARK